MIKEVSFPEEIKCDDDIKKYLEKKYPRSREDIYNEIITLEKNFKLQINKLVEEAKRINKVSFVGDLDEICKHEIL